jgi:hypothetical protein
MVARRRILGCLTALGSGYVLSGCGGSGSSPSANTQPVTTPAKTGTFYGINGRFDYRYSPAQVVSIMKGLGCSTYRVGCIDDPAQLNAVVNLLIRLNPN